MHKTKVAIALNEKLTQRDLVPLLAGLSGFAANSGG